MSNLLGDGAAAGDGKDVTLGADDAAKAAADKAAADKAAADAAAGATVSVEDQRKFLVEKGGKADELAKLDEAGLKKAYDEAKAAADKAATTVPEKYEFKAAKDAQVDADLATDVSAVAKELKLPQAEAQKIYDAATSVVAKRTAAFTAAVNKVHTEWTELSRSDKEFGGANLDANLAIAKKARDTFGGPAFQKMLVETGLGNHPEVIRFSYRVGKAISEDKLVLGATKGDGAKAIDFYPNTKMNP